MVFQDFLGFQENKTGLGLREEERLAGPLDGAFTLVHKHPCLVVITHGVAGEILFDECIQVLFKYH